MLALEMKRAITNRWFVISLATLSILSLVAGIVSVARTVSGLNVVVQPYLDTSYWYLSAYSSFRSWIAIDHVNTAIELFFVLTPLLVLMGYSWSLASDAKSGYAEQLLSRSRRSTWYVARYLSVFTSGGLLVTIPLLLNLLLNMVFSPSWQLDLADYTYIGIGFSSDSADNSLFSELALINTPLYVALRTVLDFLLCGAWCTCILAMSLFVRNRVALIAVPYLILLLAKHLGERFYVLMRTNGFEGFGKSFTLFDQLRASPTGFYCPGWLTVACLVGMLAFSLAVPYLSRKRDVL